MAIKISGVKIGELEVSIEGAEGASLKQILTAAGIHQDGMQFVINGDRKAPVTNVAAAATLRDGDTVEVFDRPQAGGLSSLGLRLKSVPRKTTVTFRNGVVLGVTAAKRQS